VRFRRRGRYFRSADNVDSVTFTPSAGGKQGPAGQFLPPRVDLALRSAPGGSGGEVFRGRRVDEIVRRLVENGISRGRRARWRARLVAKMAQDSLDSRRLHHRGDDPHPAVAPWAVERIDKEDALQQGSLREPIRRSRWRRGLRWLGRFRLRSNSRPRSRRRREHAMETYDVLAWPRHDAYWPWRDRSRSSRP
jgi:hypothetical protein